MRTRLRSLLIALLALGILILATLWPASRQQFVTPEDCVAAYCEAMTNGDVARCQRCLGETLRSQHEQSADSVRQRAKDVKGWVQRETTMRESIATLDVDGVGPSGTRRWRFRLEQSRHEWRIVAIEGPTAIATPIPYGTHVSKVRGE